MAAKKKTRAQQADEAVNVSKKDAPQPGDPDEIIDAPKADEEAKAKVEDAVESKKPKPKRKKSKKPVFDIPDILFVVIDPQVIRPQDLEGVFPKGTKVILYRRFLWGKARDPILVFQTTGGISEQDAFEGIRQIVPNVITPATVEEAIKRNVP